FLLTVSSQNDLPTISSIPDQAVGVNTATAPIPFLVGDLESAATNLTLSAVSSNPPLAPATNVVFGGSGSNRTVTATPAAGQSGVAMITVTVADTNGGTAGSSFLLTVTGSVPNTAPTLAPISNVVINEGAGEQSVNLS